MGRWTQEDVFPLTGFLASSLFAESGPTAIYRLIDDPAIKATTSAAADLAALVAEIVKKEPPLPAVITEVAADDDLNRGEARKLELAARHVFGESPQLATQSHADVESALTSPAGNDLRDFRAGKITAAVQERLLKAFGPRLLVVVIRQADHVADIYNYEADGWLFGETKTAHDSLSTLGSAATHKDAAQLRKSRHRQRFQHRVLAATATTAWPGFYPPTRCSWSSLMSRTR